MNYCFTIRTSKIIFFSIHRDKIRLTIRGAFPVFKYDQTNAQIAGFDLKVIYQVTKELHLIGKYSYLKGDDLTNNIPLIYMPSNNLLSELNYQLPQLGTFENIELQINNRYVFEQKNILASQDFVAPPKAYNMFWNQSIFRKTVFKIKIKSFCEH